MSFVDELQFHIKAGDGGDGVERWRREKYRPKGGPAGGDGGRGGDVYITAVRDAGLLARYAHKDRFEAEDGEDGRKNSQDGKKGKDLVIDLPVGSVVTNLDNGTRYELLAEGEKYKILSGGEGGLGNEHFKSSTNQRPTETTPGTSGEEADFRVELELVVDAGFVGLPNAGKSSLLNELTGAKSKVGAYEFTTLSPHLGDLYGWTLADIPGLIAGAAGGKGLGHQFLRHIKRTKVLLHCVSLEHDSPMEAYETVRDELADFHESLPKKREIVILTKHDTVDKTRTESIAASFEELGRPVYVTSILDDASIKRLSDDLVQFLEAR